MAIVIPVSLSKVASVVLRTISLFPPVPAFQSYVDNNNNYINQLPQNYSRDSSVISFGFPHSIDGPITGPTDTIGVFSIPQNAYSFVPPSFLLNIEPNTSDTYSVLLIDVDVCPIEPGISRLRVDYLDINSNSVVDYLDMPFYPEWNTHPREIQELISYSKGNFNFSQPQITQLTNNILPALNRSQLKGLSVSGTLAAAQALDNLQPQLQSHSLPLFLNNPILNTEKSILELKDFNPVITENITGLYSIYTYPSAVFGGDTFTVSVTGGMPSIGDDLYLNNYPLNSTIIGNVFTAKLPNTFNFSYKFELYIANKNKIKTSSVSLNVLGLPYIDNVITVSKTNNTLASYNDTITITGNNFENNQGLIIFNNSIYANIINWNNTSITFLVPNNVSSGFVQISTENNKIISFPLNIIPNNSITSNLLQIIPNVNIIEAGTTQSFQTLFNFATVQANWSIIDSLENVGKGTLAHGYIDNNGLYTAPINITSPFNIAIAADYLSPNGKLFAKASMTIIPTPGTLTIIPNTVSMKPNQTQLFSIYDNQELVNSNIAYYVNGIYNGSTEVGTINKLGLYQSPAGIPYNQTIHVEALYQNKSAVASVGIIPINSALDDLNFNVNNNLNIDVNESINNSVNNNLSKDLFAKGNTTLQSAYKNAAFSTGSGNLQLTYPVNGAQSQNQYNGQNGCAGFQIYWAEALDSSNKRCVTLVLWSDWTNPIWGALDFLLAFSSPAGQRVDPSNYSTYTAASIAVCLSDNNANHINPSSPMTSLSGALGNYGGAIGNNTHYVRGPLLQTGDNSTGLELPPNSTGIEWFTAATNISYDMVPLGGIITPRIVFYPPADTTQITLNDVYIISATARSQNNNGNGYVRDYTQQVNDVLKFSLPIGPLLVSPNNIVFSSPKAAAQIVEISDLNYTGNFTVTSSESGIVQAIVNNTYKQLTINPIAIGSVTLTVSDGSRSANVSVVVNQPPSIVGPLTLSPSTLNFNNIKAPYQTVTITDPNNTNPYTYSGYNPGIVVVNTAANFIYITPTAVGQVVLTVSDGTRTALLTINVNAALPGVGPLSVTPQIIVFNNPTSPFQTLTITDPYNTNPYTYTFSNLNIVKINTNENFIYIAPTAVGQTTLTVSDGTRSALVSIIVNPPPIILPTITAITEGCPGHPVTVFGTYFPPDATLVFASDTQLQFVNNGTPSSVDGVNYSMSVIIPPSVPTNPASYQVEIISSIGNSNSNVTLTIPNTCALTPTGLDITPTNENLLVGAIGSFKAVLSLSNGSTQDVSYNVLWYVQSIYGGNTTYGFIDSTGNYTAPNNVPGINPVSIQATYTSLGTPLIGTASVTINPINIPYQPPPPPPSLPGNYMLRVSPEVITIPVPGNMQQFTAELYINNVLQSSVVASAWSVNDIIGGNAYYGTIDDNGFYSPPTYYAPENTNVVKIAAYYTAQPPSPDSPIPLEGYAVATLKQVQSQSGQCIVSVLSQINIYFGDGRHGYVPNNNVNVNLNPGDYLFATYNEVLDKTYLPFTVGASQSLNLTIHAVQANDLINYLYNEGTINQLSGTSDIEDPNNVYSQPYTIVLGVCDSVTGLFQSMWDFIKIINPPIITIPSQPYTSILAHGLESKLDSFNPNYAKSKLENKLIDNVKPLKHIQSMWTGTLIYSTDDSKIYIKNPLKFIQCNVETNKFEVAFNSKIKSLKVKLNSILYYNGSSIVNSSIDEKIPFDNNNVLLGIILDKFYSVWPFLTAENKFIDYSFEEYNNANNLSSQSFITLGNMTIQWGKTNKKSGTINLLKEFSKSYNVQSKTLLNISNIKLNSFDYMSTEKDLVWIAVGT